MSDKNLLLGHYMYVIQIETYRLGNYYLVLYCYIHLKRIYTRVDITLVFGLISSVNYPNSKFICQCFTARHVVVFLFCKCLL